MPEKRYRDLVVNAGYLVAGILIIVVIVLILQAAIGYMQVKSTPPGWEIIRPPAEVSTLFIDNDTVWTGGKEGIVLINRTTRERINLPAGAPPVSYVRQIFRDHTGSIWIGHDGGLIRFTNGSWQIVAPGPGIPFIKVLSLAENKDGSIIAGTETDVFVNNGNGWQSLRSLGMPHIALAEVLLVSRSGDLWVGCGDPMRGALLRFDGTSWHPYTTNDGLPHPAVRALAEDPNGAVWAATGYSRRGGAARFLGGSWTNFTTADGLAGESTRSVFTDRQGRIWIGSEYDGIAVGSEGRWKILTEKDGLAGNEVKTMVQDDTGAYWLGTNNGLSWIAPHAAIG
jgi:ligand-binding sensor domain-containing protein